MKEFFLKHSWLFFVFIAALGFIGPITIDAAKGIYLLTTVSFLVLYRHELLAWYRSHASEQLYLKGLLFFVLYGLVLVLVWLLLPNKYALRPSYSCLEELMSNYLFMPLFCILIGQGLTQKNFERGMMLFSLGTALCSIFLLCVHYDMLQLFSAPAAFFNNVFSCRFLNCGSSMFGAPIFLKDYSFYPALGALMVVPFMVRYGGAKRLAFATLFLLNTLFLFLTVNRGTMVGFGLSLLLMFFYFLRIFSWQKRLVASLAIVTMVAVVVLMLPQSVKGRFVEIVSEGRAFFQSGHDSGSVSTRLTIWKVLLSHVKEFWLFGEGPMYATERLRMYFAEAGYQHYTDMGFVYHNQYLAYFHQYGLVGLLAMLFFLLYPLYATLCTRRFSIVLLSIIIIFAVAMMEDRYLGKNKVTMLLFLYYFSFFQVDKWRAIEKK